MIKVQINKICAKLVECEPLTAGMIGKTLDVEFSADWAAYTKTAVFSNGDTTIDVLESQWNGNTITIPAEVLSIAGRTVIFGMYGFAVENGTTVALPTIYAKIGIPMVGADPESDPTTNPSLPVYAQLQWEIDHFEISDEQIAEQIQEYLAEHPIEIQPATASVLGGVKVGEGLSVTADGTLSADVTADELDELANIVDGKQEEIADLATIRAGAALGATAVQPEAGKGLFSGNYNDLTNKPTIPTVNDAVLTIKQGGVTKGTFSANASSATEINLDAGGGGGGMYTAHMSLANGEYQFTDGASYDTMAEAFYDFGKVVVVELLDWDDNESVYVYSFGGYNNMHSRYFVFNRKDGNKTHYIYVYENNTITAEVIDLDDYAEKSDLNDYRTAAAQDVIDGGFVKLVGAAGQTIQTNVAVPLNVKNNIALQHRAFVGFQTHDDNAIGFIGVDGGKPTFLAADGVTAKALQGEAITDTAGYFTTDTVEGALAEIGAELAGINTLVGSGVIV